MFILLRVTTDVFVRPTRRPAPPLPAGDLVLEPPPALARPAGIRWQQWFSVVPMLAGTAATAMMFGARPAADPYTYVVGAMFGLSTLGLMITGWTGNGGRRAELGQARRDYLRYLATTRRRVLSVLSAQREALAHRHPHPESLWEHASGPRRWERRPGDADFGVVRIGTGPHSLATPLVAPTLDPAAVLEPVSTAALRRFLDAYAVVPDLPVCLAVPAFGRVVLAGDRADARGLARAVLAQLVTFHAPADLVVAACVRPECRSDWDWLKWLPHALHDTAVDGLGRRRLLATSPAELDELLGDVIGARPVATGATAGVAAAARRAEPAGPRVVVVLDGVDVSGSHALALPEGRRDVTVIEIAAGSPSIVDNSAVVLSIEDGSRLLSITAEDTVESGRPDAMGIPVVEDLARRLAPVRLAGAAYPQPQTGAEPDLATLAGLAAILGDGATASDGADLGGGSGTGSATGGASGTLWPARPARDVLRVPIGTAPDGGMVELDLKEAAQDGMGPHGIVVGATGSGKSELLRTLVLGLAATHSSRELNVVLIDFKGGATFASLERLPHTSAVITNLAGELPLVDRMHDALTGELTRRQEALRRAGNVASVREYHRARAGGAALPALPALLVICDEFTELLTAKPDLIDLFLHIGRLGRSLGVHLLLATQRLEEGRLRGLDANLSYRIALRTFSGTESRLLLGVPDATDLPSAPGHGYLRVGSGAPRRFTSAYVSGPYRRTPGAGARSAWIRPYHAGFEPAATGPAVDRAVAEASDAGGPSLLSLVVDRLAGQGPPAHRVWLPPLRESPTLDQLLGELTVATGRGLTTAHTPSRGMLRIPFSLVDRPIEQRRDVGWLDLAGAAGNVAIVGGPRSGKSTTVRSLMLALALTHTPLEVQLYVLDLGGGALGGLRTLPHVGEVAGRADAALIRRCVGDMAALLADRERAFAAAGVESVTAFRRSRRTSTMEQSPGPSIPDTRTADVFLIVDGWGTVRSDFDDLEPVLVDLATRGLGYGIHVVATANRWPDLRTARDLFGSRIELRLGDPADSLVDRRQAANVPPDAAGRGLDADRSHLLVAVPHTSEWPSGTLAARIAAAWPGPGAPAVRMLPDVVPYQDLLVPDPAGTAATPVPSGDLPPGAPLGDGLCLPLGVAEADLRPVLLDFAVDPHLLAFGDTECGKSSLLRGLAESISRRFTPDQARIILIDYRRGLLGAVTTDHLIGYASTTLDAVPLLESVAAHLDRRRPGPEVTARQLRERSWWSGPECFVLVDDYDLVATGATNPLAALLEYLPHARELGLRMVLARRASGAGRALYEPVLQRLRELGAAALVMSGDPAEGTFIGSIRPGPLAPGRARLVTRRHGVRVVQLAYLPPSPTPASARLGN
jgi:S-DNA-T family DNA segregation ATPase FtsK/SpoIIIE